jgi:hypothetical protein
MKTSAASRTSSSTSVQVRPDLYEVKAQFELFTELLDLAAIVTDWAS